MQRRSFLQTAAAAALAPTILGLPKQKPTIDLMPFCSGVSMRYDLRQPFSQQLESSHIYACDGFVGIRVPGSPIDLGAARKLPNAAALGWGEGSRWRPLSAAARRVHSNDDTACPTCNWRGRVGPGVEECGCWDAEFCTECHQSGYVGGSQCPECGGSGKVNFQFMIGDRRFAPRYIEIIRALADVEVALVHGSTPALDRGSRHLGYPAGFRFYGGEVLLMEMENTTSNKGAAK